MDSPACISPTEETLHQALSSLRIELVSQSLFIPLCARYGPDVLYLGNTYLLVERGNTWFLTSLNAFHQMEWINYDSHVKEHRNLAEILYVN